MNLYKRNYDDPLKTHLVIQINGHICFYMKQQKYQKQQRILKKLLQRGMLTEEELENFNNELGFKHDFGEVLNVKKFEEHEEDYSNTESGSDTSYSSDEVHDTRSFFIGYYRGPKKQKDDSEDSDDIE